MAEETHDTQPFEIEQPDPPTQAVAEATPLVPENALVPRASTEASDLLDAQQPGQEKMGAKAWRPGSASSHKSSNAFPVATVKQLQWNSAKRSRPRFAIFGLGVTSNASPK